MAESFDAVLAYLCQRGEILSRSSVSRLQSAHEAEVAERDRAVRQANSHAEHFERQYYLESDRADRAVGLLREWVLYGGAHHPTLLRDTEAFLSEQAGERENATKDSAHED